MDTSHNNVVYIEFFDKKFFPPGSWLSEPDLCYWERGLPCFALRDMSMGTWRGFVGISSEHLLYEKPLEELFDIPKVIEVFFLVHGGISWVGRLPTRWSTFAKNYWWLGIETTQGDDLIPIIKAEDLGDMAKMISHQTYRDFRFIRRETDKLAKYLLSLK